MEYEINVARPIEKRDKLYGCSGEFVHYFRVTVPYGRVKKVYEELKEKFPGYKLEVIEWEKIGSYLDMSKCNF